MAILKAKQMRELSKEELTQKLQELKNEYMVDKSAVASGTRAEKPGRMRELRRTIARIHTIQKEKLTKKPDVQKEKITKKTDVQKIEKKGIKEVRNKK